MKVTESTYQQSNFLALMNGYTGENGVLSLYAKAMDSAGTSEKKFQLYQQGTQAQLDRLKASWEGMWMSAFKSNDMQSLIGGLNGLVTVIKTVTDHVGALPPLLAVGGIALIAFNGGFKSITSTGNLMITMLKGLPSLFRDAETAEAALTLRTNLTTGATRALTLSLEGLKTAGAFAMGAFLPMLAFAGIGYAIEKVTSAISDYNQKQQEMKQNQDDLRTKYSANSDQINKLADQYKALDAQVQSGQISKTNQDYVDTMNKLGSLMPSLVASTDEQGNKVLIAANATKDQLNYAQQLKTAYDKMNKDNLTGDIQKQADQVDQLLKKIADAKNQENSPATLTGSGKAAVYSPKTSEQQYQDTIQLAESQKQLNDLLHNSSGFITDRTNAMMDMDKVTNKLSSSQKDLVDSYIKDAVASKDSVNNGQDFKNFLDDTTKQATQLASILAILPNNISKVLSVDDISGLSKKQADALRQVGLAVENGGTDWNKYKDILSKVKVPTSDIAAVLITLKNSTQEATQSQVDYVAEVQATIDAEMKKANAEEQIVGTTQNLINQSKDLITTYVLLSKQENLSADQKAALADATGKLSAMYPQFVQNGKLQVDQMGKESEAEDVLLKAVTDMANGHATAEEMMTTNAALQSKQRLKMISDQIDAYQKLIDATLTSAEADGGTMTTARMEAYQNASDKYSSKIAGLKAEVDALSGSYDTQVQHLANLTNYQGQYYDSTTKSNSATKDSKYVTDTYKQSMDGLNAAISEYSSFQNKYAKDSQSYRDVLQKEIDLLTQKEKLLTTQAVDLSHQIDSGNITQTGMINNSSDTSSSTSNSIPTLSGSNNAEQIWNFLKAKGLSDAAAAGVMGNLMQESSLAASAYNPNGATGIAQWMGGRLSGLKNFANAQGKSYTDLNVQLAWLWNELSSGGNGSISTLNNSSSASSAAAYFESTFERSGGSAVANRQNYANQFYSQYQGLGTGSPSSSNSNSSSSNKTPDQIASQKAQQIDQAKSDLLNLNQDLVSTRNQIEQLQAEIVQSKIDEVANGYNTRISDLDQSIKNSQASQKNFVEYSAKWQFENDKQINLQKQKIQANIDEENALKKLMQTMSLTADQQAKLSDQIKQLDANTYQYKNDLYDLNFQYYTAQVDMFDKKIADLNNTIKAAQSTMSLYTDNLDIQRQQTLKIIDTLNQEIATTQQDIKTIQYAISTTYISEQQKDQLRQKIADLTQAELDYANQVKQANDQLIQQYTDYYNKKAEMDKKALDDEYTAYQNAANKKLALIDKTENQNTYNEQLKQKQKAISDLQVQINQLSLDSTQKGKVADLKKQLAQDQTDLNDFMHQHDIQSQKDAINSDVQAKKDSIDQQKVQVDKYYNNLIQFQTAYTQTSEKLTNAHLENVKGYMAKFAAYVQTLFVDVGKSMDINMLNRFNNLLNVINASGGLGKINPLLFAKTAASVGVKSFDTGGYTSNDEGLAYLHSKEIILNKDDTSNFLKAIDFTRQIAMMIPKMNTPTPNNPAQTAVNINMPITIQNLSGGEQGANDFFKVINTKLRGKGGLTFA